MKRVAKMCVSGLVAGVLGLAACAGPTVVHLDSSTQESAMATPAREVENTDEGCTIERFAIPSKSMQREIKLAIVLPPEYTTRKDVRYPVLYTLHGADAPYDTFAAMAPLRKTLRDHPMIVTCFDGDKRGWYIDSTKKPESQFATFFFDEFIPYVDAHYRTRADGASRGLTGFSMGGYGSFSYMLTHPEMFAGASSLSGVFDVLGPRSGMTSLLGPFDENKATYMKYGIYNRMQDYIAKGTHLPPMFIYTGTDDGLLEQNHAMLTFLIEQNKELHKQGKEVLIFEYKESAGAHNWPFWRDASAGVADFHWRCFEQAAAKAVAASATPATTPATAPAK